MRVSLDDTVEVVHAKHTFTFLKANPGRFTGRLKILLMMSSAALI